MSTQGFHGKMTVGKTIFLIIFALLVQSLGAQTKPLSVEEAVQLTLSSDPRVQSAHWDYLASTGKIEEARLRQLPSVSVSASYTRLSDLQSTVSLGPVKMVIDSLDNAYSFAANMQYPVFAGFRVQESIKLAALQSSGKEISLDMMKSAIEFETRRAYWEAVRSLYNVQMLQENLALMENNLNIVKQQLAQGTAINADLLASQMRRDQADIDLGNAKTIRQKAFLNLASLVSDSGDTSSLKDPVSLFSLGTKPDSLPEMAAPTEPLSGTIDTDALINTALSKRPEIKAAALSVSAAEHGKLLAEAPLYPTLNLTGNYTYADPNQRAAFQSDPNAFTGTWALGVSLAWDLGGIPANLSEKKVQDNGIQKSLSDSSRQKDLILLDVRNSILSYEQTRRDSGLVILMLDQAKENERVMKERYNAGTASANDLLGASLARLRSEFTITNKQIDLQIAASDLCRAAGLSREK